MHCVSDFWLFVLYSLSNQSFVLFSSSLISLHLLRFSELSAALMSSESRLTELPRGFKLFSCGFELFNGFPSKDFSTSWATGGGLGIKGWLISKSFNCDKFLKSIPDICHFFLHSHILSPGNYRLGKCVDLRQTEPKAVIFSFFWNFFTLSQNFCTHGVTGVPDKYQVCTLLG